MKLLLSASTLRMPTSKALMAMSLLFFAMFVAAGAPSPLYARMQADWAFPSWVLTLAFAAYVVTMMLAILVVGALSDFVGRRPVLACALGAEISAMLVLCFATNVQWVIAGRALQGLATGTATATLSAMLTELAPPQRPATGPIIASFATQGGMGAGALMAGLLAHTMTTPGPMVFSLLAGTFVAGIALVQLTPETTARKPGARKSLLPHVRVPAQARTSFWGVVPVVSAVWMTGSYFMSLLPSVMLVSFEGVSDLAGAAAIALLAGTGAVCSIPSLAAPARTTAIAGCCFLIGGMAILLTAVSLSFFSWCLVAAVVSGIGFGLANSGAFRLVERMSPPLDKAQTFSGIYMACYVAGSVPVLCAGFLADMTGLKTTSYIYGVAVIVVAVLGAVAQLRPRRGDLYPDAGHPVNNRA